MDNQEITSLLSKIANADQILSDPGILSSELQSVVLPQVSVLSESIGLSLENRDAYTINTFPILVKSVESSIDRQAFADLSKMAQLQARIVQALCERHAAELQLFIRYGVLCRYAVRDARPLAG